MSGVLQDCISGHGERLQYGEVVHTSGRESSELGWVWLAQMFEGPVRSSFLVAFIVSVKQKSKK